MKKILALLLAVVMCFAFIAACDNEAPPPPPPEGNQSGGTDGVDYNGAARRALAEQYGLPYWDDMDTWAPITLTYFDRGSGAVPAETNPFMNIVEEITNVKVVFQMNIGDLNTAMGNMISTGDVADMTFFGGAVDMALESGLFIPLEDLIEEHAPTLRQYYDPWWDFMKYAVDGKMYTAEIWSTYNPDHPVLTPDTNQHAFWIQKDVLDHFGRAPKDIYEYFEFLREYKDTYPTIDGMETIAFSLVNKPSGVPGNLRRLCLENGGMWLSGSANWGAAYNTDGVNADSAITPSVLERWTGDFNYRWWKILNEEFNRYGTFSMETFTLEQSDFVAQIATGAVLGFHDALWNEVQQAHDALIAEGRPERSFLPLGLSFDGTVYNNYLDAPSFTGSNGINISVNNPDPVRTVKLWEWIIQEDVQRWLYWGNEGEDYFYDENGRIARTQEVREQQATAQWVTDNMGRWYLNKFPKIQGSYSSDGNPCDTGQSPEEYVLGLSDYDRELFERLGIDRHTAFMGDAAVRPVFYPYWSFQPADGTPESVIFQDIGSTFDQVAIMVMAPEDEFDALFEIYKAEMSALDLGILDEFYRERAQNKLDIALGLAS